MASRDDDAKPADAAGGKQTMTGKPVGGDGVAAGMTVADAERGEDMGEAVPVLDARALLGARGLVHIAHAGQVYTLRVTRNDRLILTK